MTTLTSTVAATTSPNVQGASFLPWISQGLEGLWLLTIFLVPLVFLDQGYAVSEAKIAYVEVPKVALLRTLAGLIALLWLLEWAIMSRAFQGSFPAIRINGLAGKLRFPTVMSVLTIWIKVHPTRWFLLAAGLFFGSTFLSTVFSGSFIISMWGEVPGQDGYSAYTIASYGILFSIIATHLKSRAQLGRLLGAIVAMGFLVGLYAILQHYGHDFFNLLESTGGGTYRVSVFMGNAIFAAAVLAMTVTVTLVVAAINFRDENWGGSGPWSKLDQSGRDAVCTFLWAIILAVQLLGLIFTFSRGPWMGAALALVVFLIFVVLSVGWRILIRTSLLLGLSGVLALAFLQLQGSVSVVNLGSWLGFVIALLGLAGTFAILYAIKKFGPAIVSISIAGAIVTFVGVSVLASSALSDSNSANSAAASEEAQSEEAQSTVNQIETRIIQIKNDVLNWSGSGRNKHWKISWTLIKDRPWFEFDALSFPWMRQFIGYGPDLFRYTYLLESTPGNFRFLPEEADHAHNFFIHQTVEQGIFGGVASLALFASAFGVACHHLLRRRRNADPMYRLLLFGLVAIIAGRFLEMMVGVSRISDLTILWVLFGLFAALARFDDGRQEEPKPVARPFTEFTGRRNRRRAVRASTVQSFSTALIFRLAIVAWLVGGIGVVTWQKSINSVRASVAEGHAVKHFRNGDLESSIEDLDKAIKLAPGIPSYYNNRASLSLYYQARAETITEPGCAQQNENPYQVCLGLKALNSNLEAVDQLPFNFRARVKAANSALNLGLTDSAMDLYQAAAALSPNSYGILNQLAQIRIDLGFYNEALEELDRSLSITGESNDSITALHLKGRLFWEIKRYDDAVQTLKHGLSIGYSEPSISLLHDIYTMQGVIGDIGYFDKLINENSNDSAAFYFRGLANRRLGNKDSAASDMKAAAKLGLRPKHMNTILKENREAQSIKTVSDARFALAYHSHIRPDDKRYESALMVIGQKYLDLGLWKEATESFTQSISIFPNNAASYKNRGDALFALKRYQEATKDYERAAALNPLDSVNSVALGKVYAALGDYETARFHFNRSIQLNPNSSDVYAARGFLSVQTGDYSMGFLDIDQAIKLSPTNHDAFFKKAHAHIGLNQTSLALDNLNKAITLAPINSDYFHSRGLLKTQLKDYTAAIADFTVSIELNSFLANNDPRYAEPFVGRGSAEFQAGNTDGALNDYERALKLLEHQFDTPEWDYYRPTIDLQLSDVHELLGDSYGALGRHEEARNEYEQASRYR